MSGGEGNRPSSKIVARAPSKCNNDKLVDPLHHHTQNGVIQKNPLVPNFWRMGVDDEFVETLELIANTSERMSNIFDQDFKVLNGTEKLSSEDKMAIALLMHEKSPFSEGSSFQAHRGFTFSSSSGKKEKILDGRNCMILQSRCFSKTESGSGIVKEVPSQSASADVVTVHEVVFDAKGLTTCKHSLWFDAHIFQSKDEAEQVKVNYVHSKPYMYMVPIDNSSYELIHSIMKKMIEHNGGHTVFSELCEKFIQLNNFNRRLSWPETSPPSTDSPKSIASHVNSQYTCCEGGKVELIWKSFYTNLASLKGGDEAPKGSRLSAFRKLKEAPRSVVFASSLPKLLKNNENIADFLADYSPQ